MNLYLCHEPLIELQLASVIFPDDLMAYISYISLKPEYLPEES